MNSNQIDLQSKKMKILDRLVKEGAIDLGEALVLLETEKETVFVPYEKNPSQPYRPYEPYNPWPIIYGVNTIGSGVLLP